ncbi:ankyrin repeat domain-containing protein 26-like isoform 2-T2 [Thomomys bottae]
MQGRATTNSRFPNVGSRGRKEINTMEDLHDLTLSCDVSHAEYCEVSESNYENILFLLDQLRTEWNDVDCLSKIQNTIQSFYRLIQLKSRDCKVFQEVVEEMEKEVSSLQRKVSKTKHERAEKEEELCNMRFALKQEEEKRRNNDWIYEKMKEQLREKYRQYNEEFEMKEQLDSHVRILTMELKSIGSNLSQTVDERNDIQRKLSQEQSGRLLQDKILANHLSKQKEIKMAKEKVSSENHDLIEKVEITSSKCLLLDKENELLRQELQSMSNDEKKCARLEKDKKKLEQEVESLKYHMKKNMVDCRQIEYYIQEIKDQLKQNLVEKLKQVYLFLQTQATYQETLEQLRMKQSSSTRSPMKLRINELKTELSSMRNQVDCSRMEIELYKQLYLEEVKLRKVLSNKLSRAKEKLMEVQINIRLQKQQNRYSQHSAVHTGPALKSTFAENPNHSIFIQRSFPIHFSTEKLIVPTSNSWPSIPNYEL